MNLFGPRRTPDSSMEQAAQAGDAEAQFALGFFHAAQPQPQDYAQALQWYQKAADQNHRLAQFNLSQMYTLGQGVTRSDSMAMMWLRRAAQGGDAGAQFHLGDRCERACMHGSEDDAVESRIESYKWFKLSAAQEYGDAPTRTDAITMRMSVPEVSEGNRRVQAFAVS